MAEQGSERDLGGAGGGKVPGKMSVGMQPTGVSSNEPKDTSDSNVQETKQRADPVEPNVQGNLGQLEPGASRSAQGDQDRTRSRPGEEVGDPMTSRAPETVKQQIEQEREQ